MRNIVRIVIVKMTREVKILVRFQSNSQWWTLSSFLTLLEDESTFASVTREVISVLKWVQVGNRTLQNISVYAKVQLSTLLDYWLCWIFEWLLEPKNNPSCHSECRKKLGKPTCGPYRIKKRKRVRLKSKFTLSGTSLVVLCCFWKVRCMGWILCQGTRMISWDLPVLRVAARHTRTACGGRGLDAQHTHCTQLSRMRRRLRDRPAEEPRHWCKKRTFFSFSDSRYIFLNPSLYIYLSFSVFYIFLFHSVLCSKLRWWKVKLLTGWRNNGQVDACQRRDTRRTNERGGYAWRVHKGGRLAERFHASRPIGKRAGAVWLRGCKASLVN